MNIFVLDTDPETCASYHCDKHVIKMILEHTQILCTVYHKAIDHQIEHCSPDALQCLLELKSKIPYKATHKNHPSVLWAGKSDMNRQWLNSLTYFLNKEYRSRFNHSFNHKSFDAMCNLPEIFISDEKNLITEFPQVMPDEFKCDDVVSAYRSYYQNAKYDICAWKNSCPPWWVDLELKIA